jgi:hypothetical protein
MERRQYAIPHSKPKGGGRPFQGGGLAKDDPIIEDAWIGAKWRYGKDWDRRKERAAKGC